MSIYYEYVVLDEQVCERLRQQAMQQQGITIISYKEGWVIPTR
ncbi:MAG TPA: hypothetical protein VE944_26970 [Nostoc sp.]|nr:hypothetical protein [Nostoc sp.]HYX17937.1 hypothetical protein [Nostoc sp.]